MAQLNSLLVTGDSRFLNTINGDINGNAATATTASKLEGTYSGNGGQQPPNYFGRNKVGALMSNATVNGDSHYKNWLYMDNYNGADAGGATAIGVDRTEARAFIMQSNANRTTWNNTAELATTAYVTNQIGALDGTITGSAGAGKTLTAFSQTDGKVTATFGNISITKSQISDFPTIPAAQVNSDWNATSGVAKILNKPTIPAAQVNSDWSASSGVAQILNKPTTLSGYGITDAKIASGTITLGNNTITPLTSSSSLNAAKLTGTVPASCYTDTWTAMVGATSSANGSVGYVNAVPPKDGYNTKFLRADGSWETPAYPTVNNKTLKLQLGGTDKKSFTANSATDVTANFVFTAGTTPSTVTSNTVVNSASGATAVYANGILTITDGSFGTGAACTVTAGTAPSLAIN